MSNRIIIVGIFNEIIELAEELDYEIIGFFDNSKTGMFNNYKILGSDDDAFHLHKLFKDSNLFLSPDSPIIRMKLYEHYKQLNFNFTNLISKKSIVSQSAKIGVGTLIQAYVNISSECRIGNFVRLNTGCNVMHNSVIGNFSTIAPNSVILGSVNIGEMCYIGANATVLPGLKICNGAVIGAGAVVTKNIEIKATYIGSPAKILEK